MWWKKNSYYYCTPVFETTVVQPNGQDTQSVQCTLLESTGHSPIRGIRVSSLHLEVAFFFFPRYHLTAGLSNLDWCVEKSTMCKENKPNDGFKNAGCYYFQCRVQTAVIVWEQLQAAKYDEEYTLILRFLASPCTIIVWATCVELQ